MYYVSLKGEHYKHEKQQQNVWGGGTFEENIKRGQIVKIDRFAKTGISCSSLPHTCTPCGCASLEYPVFLQD